MLSRLTAARPARLAGHLSVTLIRGRHAPGSRIVAGLAGVLLVVVVMLKLMNAGHS